MPVICILRKIFLGFDTSQAELIKSLQSYLPFLGKEKIYCQDFSYVPHKFDKTTYTESFLIY